MSLSVTIKVSVKRLLSLCFLIFIASCSGGGDDGGGSGGSTNTAPVANAGADQTLSQLTQVTVDGGASSDAETATAQLQFSWSFVSVPALSLRTNIDISGANSVSASFIPDVPGTYVLQLIVNDGTLDSSPDNVSITVNDSNASTQIAAALTQSVTTIDGAVVTYIIPAIGNDAAGFTLQADNAGPAIFIAVDPTTTTPVLQAGDIVKLDAQSFQVNQGRVEVTAIANLLVYSSGYDVSQLAQNIDNTTDLVSALDNYALEIVHASLTLSSDLSLSGTGFLAATAETNVITANTSLSLRIPESINSGIGLVSGCIVTISNTPLWRFNATVQVAAWQNSDLTVNSCPAAILLGGIATSANEIKLSFNRNIDSTSVLSDGSQFVINGGISIVSATVSGADIYLQTTAQSSGISYDVTADTSILDSYGANISVVANSASVLGYTPMPNSFGDIVINEMMIDPSTVSDATGEWIELYNSTANLLNLRDCVVSDLGSDSHAIKSDLLIAPNGFVTLAKSASPGFTPDYVLDTGFALDNTGDEVIVTCNLTEIDRVVYDNINFTIPTGASLSLSSTTQDASSNDAAAAWCAASSSYNGDNGTPGSDNGAC